MKNLFLVLLEIRERWIVRTWGRNAIVKILSLELCQERKEFSVNLHFEIAPRMKESCYLLLA